MRNVNLAHGSLYLAGAYIGFEVSRVTGSWVLAFPVAFIAMALLGVILQVFVFRHLDGQDLQQTLITIGISIVLADLMLWRWGGEFYQIYAPDWLSGPIETFIQSSISRRTRRTNIHQIPLCPLIYIDLRSLDRSWNVVRFK